MILRSKSDEQRRLTKVAHLSGALGSAAVHEVAHRQHKLQQQLEVRALAHLLSGRRHEAQVVADLRH